jgi:DNA recombination protein RmuC
MDAATLVLIVLALLAGIAFGWLLGSRPAAQLRAERDTRESEFKAAAAELGRAQIELATLRAEAGGPRRAAGAVPGARGQVDARTALPRARRCALRQGGRGAGGQAEGMLQPVERSLKRYEEGSQGRGADARSARRCAKRSPCSMPAMPGCARDGQSWSTRCVRSPKARGRWGEQQQQCARAGGALRHADFATEVSVNSPTTAGCAPM